MYVQKCVDNDERVIVMGSPPESWVQDMNEALVSSPHFMYHYIGETLHDAEGPIPPRVGMELIDDVVFQLMFRAKTYECARIVAFGGLHDTFKIVARISLFEDVSTELHAYISDRYTQSLPSTSDEDLQTLEAYRVAFQRCQFVGTNCKALSDLLGSNNIVQNLPSDIDPVFITTPRTNTRDARAAFADSFGLAFPSHSKLFLCVNNHREYLLDVIGAYDAAARADPTMCTDDASFLVVCQPYGDVRIAEAIQNATCANYIVYIRTALNDETFVQLLDCCEYAIHGNHVDREHAQRGATVLPALTAEYARLVRGTVKIE